MQQNKPKLVKTPRDRLHAARAVARLGHHAEALKEFIWFHYHALDQQPAMAGIRLSFALDYWMELASVYPPARAALEKIRDEKSTLALTDAGTPEIFSDVVAINKVLGHEERTHRLFAGLDRSNPALADRCLDQALPAVVKAGDFALARKYLPEPENQIRDLSAALNRDVQNLKRLPRTLAPLLRVRVRNYVSKTRLLLAVVAGTDQGSELIRLKGLSCDLLQPVSLRAMVKRILESE